MSLSSPAMPPCPHNHGNRPLVCVHVSEKLNSIIYLIYFSLHMHSFLNQNNFHGKFCCELCLKGISTPVQPVISSWTRCQHLGRRDTWLRLFIIHGKLIAEHANEARNKNVHTHSRSPRTCIQCSTLKEMLRNNRWWIRNILVFGRVYIATCRKYYWAYGKNVMMYKCFNWKILGLFAEVGESPATDVFNAPSIKVY